MSIVSSIMVPHPPLIVPKIGKGKELEISNTVKAYNDACKFVKDSKPDTIIIISPHSTYFNDYFHILTDYETKGSLINFGDSEDSFELDTDTEFIEELSELYKDCGFLGEKNTTLDHGTMVPLYFLNKYITDVKYIVIGLSGLPLKEHYKLGMCIREVSNKLNRRVSIVASGDLSHKLLETGPYGFNKYGPIYDKKIMNTMSKAKFNELLEYDDTLLKEAAECGHPSFTIMAGAYDRENVESKQLSYEGTFGVGYGVCTFKSKTANNNRNFYEKYLKIEKSKMNEIRSNESEYVRLARESVENFVKNGTVLKVPNWVSKELLDNKKAVFTTLHKYNNLRGCIGTIFPFYNSIAEEIIENAVRACHDDYRFNPVTIDELDYITYSVDILSDIEPVYPSDRLDPKRFGVIVTSENKRGLLLPNIDGVDTVEQQLDIAKQKGNISSDEEVTIQKFEVKRYY